MVNIGRKPKKVVEEQKPEIQQDVKIYSCVSCGFETDSPRGKFYKSQSIMYKGNDGYVPICVSCLKKRLEELTARFGERTAMITICHYMDVPFYYAVYDSVRMQDSGTLSIGMYMRQMNNKQYTGRSFINTLLDKKELAIDESTFEEIKERTRWKNSEHRNKNNTIEIIGFDPFEGYTEDQRRFLFNNIIGYLDEDGIEEDNYKISQIIQLVINNYQITQLDIAIAKLDMMTQANDMRVLQSSKKALVDANDKIAKENGISVRNRKDDNANKSGFTGLQKRLRELNIKEAEVNFYDQLKSEGTQWAANMSLKAIKENGFFDENDYKDMMESQYLMIHDLQGKIDDIEEQNRLLLIENDELKAGGKK